MSHKFPVVEGGRGVGGVGVANLKLTEAVTILTTNHSHSRLSLVRGFHFRISALLPTLADLILEYLQRSENKMSNAHWGEGGCQACN